LVNDEDGKKEMYFPDLGREGFVCSVEFVRSKHCDKESNLVGHPYLSSPLSYRGALVHTPIPIYSNKKTPSKEAIPIISIRCQNVTIRRSGSHKKTILKVDSSSVDRNSDHPDYVPISDRLNDAPSRDLKGRALGAFVPSMEVPR